tara:strand:+ start:14734 stop:15216 length:483 start_codon:yes stop_codon:yes gene_type:complete
MKKYEAIIILNPNLSSKVENFIKDFEKLLKANTFVVKKIEDIGRRQLSYSINNHNKGHYLFFNIEGNALNLIDIENKIKYDESIIRHLFISVKEHDGEDSQLLIESRNKKSESNEEVKALEDDKTKSKGLVKKNEEDLVSEQEPKEDNVTESKEEESIDE